MPTTAVKPNEVWRNFWTRDGGLVEAVIEVEQEPRHHIDFVNDYTRIITIRMPPGDTTLAHRHTKDTIVVILMEDGIDFINDVMGCDPQQGRMEFGQVGFAPYTTQPCVHKITNLSPKHMFVVNVEILDKRPPISQSNPFAASFHTLVREQDNCRVYKLSLKPREAVAVSYPFFYVLVVLQGGHIRTFLKDVGEAIQTDQKDAFVDEDHKMGDCQFKEPCHDVRITNIGNKLFEAYICELI